MKLIFRDPPEESKAALDQGLAGMQPLGVIAAAPSPHEVYSVGLGDLSGSGGLEAAKPVGWRYFVSGPDQKLRSAEVNMDEAGKHDFAQVNSGPYNESTLAAIHLLQNTNGQGEFEFRLLRIPALYLVAVWLKSMSTGDRFIPMAPAPRRFTPGKMYDASAFECLLRQAAREKLPSRSPQTNVGEATTLKNPRISAPAQAKSARQRHINIREG